VKVRDHYGDLGVDGRIILRCIFGKCDVWEEGVWTGSSWHRIGTGLRTLVNAVMNLRGSIKCGEFLD
jgi:hypothetical protein